MILTRSSIVHCSSLSFANSNTRCGLQIIAWRISWRSALAEARPTWPALVIFWLLTHRPWVRSAALAAASTKPGLAALARSGPSSAAWPAGQDVASDRGGGGGGGFWKLGPQGVCGPVPG